MTARRRYQLLCPIARALDVVGDRWALLILRDLHAGPARFQELQTGLGIATNLLSTRLMELVDSQLIERADGEGYRLTAAGRDTDRILWELARFGAQVDRDANPREPGNLRTVALPLRILLESVADRPELVARLIIDDAELTIATTSADVHVEWGRTTGRADITVSTDYEAFLDVAEGMMNLDDFVAEHLDITDGAEHTATFLALFERALTAVL